MANPEPVRDDRGEPNCFVRSFVVPAASPWDQHRAAMLNARVNSPSNAPDLRIDVRRSEPWRPNQPGRFCAAYVRAAELPQPFVVERPVEGRIVEFRFTSPRIERAQRLLLLRDVALGVALLISLTLAVGKLVEVRSARAEALARAIQSEHAVLRAAAEQRQETRTVGRLVAAGLDGRSGGDLIRDLGWLARSRTAGVKLQSVEWDRGAMTVTASGTAPPAPGAVQQLASQPAGIDAPSAWTVNAPAQTFAPPPTLGAETFHPSMIPTPSPQRARQQ